MASHPQHTPRPRRGKGFRAAGGLIDAPLRQASEKRGFAVSRLVTHWDEIVGAETASIARPVKVSYARGGFGATLTVLTSGAHAPLLAMREPALRERINACYGYAAISRIRITQTAAHGFAEAQTAFASQEPERADPPSAAQSKAADLAESVTDPTLRAALTRLGAHVLAKST